MDYLWAPFNSCFTIYLFMSFGLPSPGFSHEGGNNVYLPIPKLAQASYQVHPSWTEQHDVFCGEPGEGDSTVIAALLSL